MTQLFISHSSKNNAEALALSQWLTQEGWDDQFLDIDPQRGIGAGERWERALHQAAGRCDAVLFLVSAHWLGSDWCRREFTIAQGLGKRLFVLLIGGTKRSDVEAHIKDIWQLVDLSGGTDHGAAVEITLDGETKPRFVYFSQSALVRLREGLKKAGLDPQSFPWPPADEPKRAPYRGMLPLEAQDAGIFFGREAPTIEILAQLRGLHAAAPPRFMAILGASGAGKSSLLRAGILPRLKRDDRYFLPLPVIRPERAALTGNSGLLESLLSAGRLLGWTRKQVTLAIETGTSALLPLLRQLAEHAEVPDAEGQVAAPPTLVLTIDQAEELFQSEGRAEATRFLTLLSELLLTESPRIMALCTIRSDSYEHLQSAAELSAIPQRTFSLPPLPKGAYRQVIEGPAALLKHSMRPLHIEAQLTEALLRDVEEGGAKDALPLLAFTLERLYVDIGADGQLTLQEYQDLGRIGGAIETAVDQTLKAAQSNPKLPQDRDECLKLLRRGLIPWMAGIDPRTNLPYRKVARLAQVPEEARALIEHFVDRRLLAKDKDARGEVTVEPAHEALLRQWTKLRGWLEEDAAALSALEAVKTASRDWEANARNPNWFTHAAGRLEDAETLYQRTDLAANFDSVDRAYVAGCRKAEDEQRDNELRRARELAEAQQQRAEQQRQVVKRTRIGLVVSVGLLGVALVAGLVAKGAQEEALIETARVELNLTQAATRAHGRAREQLEAADPTAYLAYLSESIGYVSSFPSPASEEAALAIQQQALPILRWTNLNNGDFVISPDGLRIFTVDGDGNGRLWDAANGSQLGLPMRHELDSVTQHQNTIHSGKFSPDGSRLVTISGNHYFDFRAVRLWDARSGAPLGALLQHASGIESVDFSADSSILTIKVNDGVRILDAGTGHARDVLITNVTEYEHAVSSRKGSKRITISDDGVQFWDSATGALIGAPIRHGSRIRFAVISPNESRLITIGEETLRLWNSVTGAALAATVVEDSEHVNSAIFSPDSTKLAVKFRDAVHLLDSTTGTALGAPIQHQDLLSVVFSPDNTKLVTVSSSDARLWDASTGSSIGRPMQHESLGYYYIRASSAVFSADGKRVVTTMPDYTARLWDTATGKALGKPLRHEQFVVSADFSLDGRRVVTASIDVEERSIHTHSWDVAISGAIGLPMRHQQRVHSAFFSPDGGRIVTASGRLPDLDSSADVHLWNASTGVDLGALEGTGNGSFAVLTSSGGRLVVTTSSDSTAQLRDIESGKALQVPIPESINFASFSADDAIVLTGANGAAQLWDVATGAALGAPIPSDSCCCGALSADAKRVLMVCAATVQLWDGLTGAPMGLPMLHANHVPSAAFSIDGTRVLTASWDGSARLWNGTTGIAVGAPMLHGEGVRHAAFSPDAKKVVTAGQDGSAQLWDGQTGAALGRPMRHQSPVLFAVFSPDGARVVTAGQNAQFWDATTGAALGAPIKANESIYSAILSPDGSQLLTTGLDNFAQLWDVASAAALGAPVEPRDLLALSGRRVAENGQIESIPGLEQIEIINEAKTRAEQGVTPKDRVMRWQFADRSTRTISPFSQITVPQFIEREIDWVLKHPQAEMPDGPNYSPKILDDAYNLDPGHPLILLAHSVFETRSETRALWKRLSFPRFENDARLAARAAEILLIDKDPENARMAAEMALNLPSATEADKAKAQAVLDQISSSKP